MFFKKNIFRTCKMKQIDFSNGKTAQNIFLAAFPMLVAQVLNLMYNIVDRIYIGRIPGEGVTALGGVGVCFPLITVITAFTNLYGVGGAPLCSIERGRRNLKGAQDIMNTSFILLVGTAVILTLTGEIFCRPVLYLFGASDTTIVYAEPYMRIYLAGTVFSMVSLGLNPFINSQGFSSVGMMTVFIGAAANIVLDPIFIFLFGMGVSGAALATILSQLLSAIFVLRFLTSDTAELKLDLRGGVNLKLSTVKNIIGLGVSSFVMQVNNSLIQVVNNNVLGSFGGDMYISAMTIINSVRQILDTPALAITDGASPVLSYNYGAGKYKDVKKAVFLVTGATLGYTGIVWLLIFLFPVFFISIFNSDSSLLSVAVTSMHTYFFAYIFQALQFSGQMVFKSLGKKKQTIFFSILRKVIIVVPLTIILPHVAGLGARGVFMAEPVSNVVGGTACFTAMLLMIMPELNKKKERNAQNTL